MRIVVIGGSGRVGAEVVDTLVALGHDVAPASRRTGVDAVTGAGLDAALAGAEVLVDVINAPTFDEATAGPFFETSTRRLLAAGAAASVGHHVTLSIVGAERLQTNGYFRAKLAQERLVQASGRPFTILRSTQFFEFLPMIVADGATVAGGGGEVRLAPARIQPIAAADAGEAVARLATAPPQNATVEVAGPDVHRLDEIVRDFLTATGDDRRVVGDPHALYFGTALTDETLMAGAVPRFGHTEFEAWLRRWVREAGVSAARPALRLV